MPCLIGSPPLSVYPARPDADRRWGALVRRSHAAGSRGPPLRTPQRRVPHSGPMLDDDDDDDDDDGVSPGGNDATYTLRRTVDHAFTKHGAKAWTGRTEAEEPGRTGGGQSRQAWQRPARASCGRSRSKTDRCSQRAKDHCCRTSLRNEPNSCIGTHQRVCCTEEGES